MIKHSKFFGFMLLLVLILLSACSSSVVDKNAPSYIPVTLGKEFNIREHEIARINAQDIELQITDLVYKPCPPGVYCTWEDFDVLIEVAVNGVVYGSDEHPLKDLPYAVTLMDTNYQTSASFVIDTIENDCNNQYFSDECWKNAAVRLSNISYCDLIDKTDTLTSDSCYEDIANDLNEYDLCSFVSTPTHYCLLWDIVAENNISRCKDIILWDVRSFCYQTIVKRSDEGVALCNTLDVISAETCSDAVLSSS